MDNEESQFEAVKSVKIDESIIIKLTEQSKPFFNKGKYIAAYNGGGIHPTNNKEQFDEHINAGAYPIKQ